MTRFVPATSAEVRAAYNPATEAYGAAASADAAKAAREKVFTAAGSSSTSYALISPTQSVPDSVFSSLSRVLKLAGNLVYSFDFRLHPTAPQSIIAADTDEWMYDYYVGARSPTTILKAVRDKFLTTGSTPGNNAIRDQYIEMINDVLARMTTPVPGTLTDALLGKTWNDGRYTYKIDNKGVVTTSGKTFAPEDANYNAVASNLNSDYKAGKLKSGAVPAYTPKPSVSVPSFQVPAPVVVQETGVMDEWWFWPAVGLGTLATAAGTYFLFFRRKKEE